MFRIPALAVALAFACAALCSEASAADFHPISGVSTNTTDLWPVSNLIQGPAAGYEARNPTTRSEAAAVAVG